MAEEPFTPTVIRCSLMQPLFVHDDFGTHEYRAVKLVRTSPTTVEAVYEAVATERLANPPKEG